jgi:hypothetical protein
MGTFKNDLPAAGGDPPHSSSSRLRGHDPVMSSASEITYPMADNHVQNQGPAQQVDRTRTVLYSSNHRIANNSHLHLGGG